MQLRGLMYYTIVNMKYSLTIFWSIMCGLLLLTIGFNIIFGGDAVTLFFDFSFPIYIFAGIMGFWIVKNVIPYTIKLGSTRMNVYIGTGLSLLLLAVFNAIVSNTIHSIVKAFNGNISSGSIHITVNDEAYEEFFYSHVIDFFGENTWLNRFIVDTTVSIFFIAIMFILGLIFYRYHLIGGLSFLAVAMVCGIYSLSKGWAWDIITAIFTDFSIAFFYQLLLIGIVIYLLSYLLLKRMTV